MMWRRYLIAAAMVSSSTAAPVAAVHAQATGVLEEITVTARRREESQQTVPVSVSALDAQALERTQINNAIDLQRQVPGLSVTAASPTRDQFSFSLRGQRTQEFQLLTDAPVGTYFAEVVQPRPTGFGQVLFDLQNIQVLKGVQGTLFGRNMTGGAILVEPAHPKDTLEASAAVTAGNYDLRKYDAMINVPAGDIVAMRFAAQHYEHNGYSKDLTTGRDFDDDDADAWRASINIKPIENLESLFIYDGMQNRKNGTAVYFGHAVANPNCVPGVSCRPVDLYSSTPNPNFGGFPPNVASPGTFGLPAFLDAPSIAAQQAARNSRRQFAIGSGEQFAAFSNTRNGGLPYDNVDNWGLTNKTQYTFGDYTLKNIAGYRHLKWNQLEDLDGSILPWIYSQQGQDIKTISEELQLQGKSFGEKFSWIVGGYFFREYGLDESISSQFPELARLSTAGSLAAPPFGTGTLPPNTAGQIASALTAQDFLLDSPGRGNAKTAAGFASGTYSLTEQWKFTAGLRYTTDEREVTVTPARKNLPLSATAVGTCAWNDDTNAANAVNYATVGCSHSGSHKWNAWTWDGTVQYQPTQDMMAYASVRRGFRAGGYSLRAQSALELQPFNPEYVTEYEIGSKSDWQFGNDSALRLNGALFYQDYTDVQTQERTSQNNVVKTIVLNIPKKEIYGAELEVTYVPFRDLTFSAAYAWLKAHILDAGIDPYTGLANTAARYALVGSAENTVNVNANWRLPLPTDIGDVSVNASWSWQGESHLVDSDVEGTEPAYDLLNVKLAWDNIFSSGVGVAAFCNNVTDKLYRVGAISLQSTGVGYTGDLFGDPRTYGMEVNYKFGR